MPSDQPPHRCSIPVDLYRKILFWLDDGIDRTAVLPVWRSPMINSRWPRPIGIIESIVLIPVWSGSFTGWRKITPGALRSSGISYRSPFDRSFAVNRLSECIHYTAQHTVTSFLIEPICQPVFTVSPSRIPFDSPRSTAPTLSSSKVQYMSAFQSVFKTKSHLPAPV